MQNYYLHQQLSQSSSIQNLQPYRYDQDKSYLIGSRGNCIQMYRIFFGELSFVDRFYFDASIFKVEVIPSKHHRYDYLFVVDCKGRFYVWHQGVCDYVDNTIIWQNMMSSHKGVYSGISYQFEEKDTLGVVFYSNRFQIVLVQFGVNLRGVNIDTNSIIKYTLPAVEIRHIGWIKHSHSIFLLGLIQQLKQKTILTIYDLEKGLGICEQSLEWSLEKINLLQFYSQNDGEILVMTYNEIALYRYKKHYPLKNYRTRGNYGQGFVMDRGYYGHIGEELIVFSQEKLRSYGEVKKKKGIGLDDLAYSRRVDEKTVLLETYQGGTYLLYINEDNFQICEIFAQIGQILEIQALKQGSKFITVNQDQQYFSVNMLQSQLQIPFQTQQLLQVQNIQQVFSIKGGAFLIICSQSSNQVHRMNKANIYEFYVQILQGNIVAAEQNFIVYEDGIYEIDYQSQTLTKMIEKQIIMCEIINENIYYLTADGIISRLEQDGNEQIIAQDRQDDYCWGKVIKSNTLLTASLSQSRQITLINGCKAKKLTIKGHTLLSCMASIQASNRRSNDKIVIGYVDGQIHVHDTELFHSIIMLDIIANSPPKFCIISNHSIIAYYGSKQILIRYAENQVKSINLSINISKNMVHFIHYISKSQSLCFIKQQQIIKTAIIRQGKFPRSLQAVNFHSSLSLTMKLDEWSNTVPLLKKMDDRLLIAGANQMKIYRLQNGKVIKKMKHTLQQIISINIIKLGILLCGVIGDKEMMLLIDEQLQIKAQFLLNSDRPLRMIRNCLEDNEFMMGYSDYITIYKITETFQLVPIMGSKIEMQSCAIDLCQSLILVNDPSKKLMIYKRDDAITILGEFMPAYQLINAIFIEEDMVTVDHKGNVICYFIQKQQNIGRKLKFSKIFSINVCDTITSLHKQSNLLYYTTKNGKIGSIRKQYPFPCTKV